MIEDHNLSMSEGEYRDLEIPSYSMLSSISKQGLDVVGGVKQSFNLKFGSLVDVMCFEPDRVDELFYRGSSVKPPTQNIRIILDAILDVITKPNEHKKSGDFVRKYAKNNVVLTNYTAQILAAARALKVYTSYNDERIVKTVVSGGSAYFADKLQSQGKNLIKDAMWDHAAQTANTLRTHPFTAKFFATGVKDVQIFYQYKFDTKVNGRRVKGMLDCLVVNHKHKVIIPVDLKTGESPCKDFPILYTMHRYYIQGALYREALKTIVDNDFELHGYTVKEFEFVYISKLNPNRPMRFLVSEDMHQLALNGFTDRHGVEYQGVYELIDLYYYSKENDDADYTQDQIDTEGLVLMDAESITGNNNLNNEDNEANI